MQSLLGFQLPLQRRLTKMYSDTKSSTDFVKEPVPVAKDPELLLLHRKLRIQKDRLVSWGLGWSDPAQSPDIDESLSKAGLSDLVGSIMSTIKDILAEAEPLWQSSRKDSETRPGVSSKTGTEQKITLIVWDRARFEDLVRDLTSSIDTLYDVSRTRQKTRQATPKPSSPLGQAVLFDEGRRFETTRMQTPQQVDPGSLIDPPGAKFEYAPSLRNPTLEVTKSRHIMYLERLSSSNNPWKFEGPPPKLPVLVEYATYDPIYASTGISPDMNRFEKLFAGLQTFQDDCARASFGVLNLTGYFEDALHARFGMIYELPTRFEPLDSTMTGATIPSMFTLSDVLSNRMLEPPLETKYRLAYNLATSVFDMHSKGVVHGNLAAAHVTFFEKQSFKNDDALSQVNLRRPYLTSFELFPDTATWQGGVGANESETLPYRHSLDPRTTPYTVLTHESRSLDLYSLATLLLEIGLWTPAQDIASSQLGISIDPVTTYKQLATRCGTSYLRAVQACWQAIDDEIANQSRPDVVLQKIYGRVLNALERCCSIEDSSEEEDILEAIERSTFSTSAVISKREETQKNEQEFITADEATEDDFRIEGNPSDQLSAARTMPSYEKEFELLSTELDGGKDQDRIFEIANNKPISAALAPVEHQVVTKSKSKVRRFPNHKIIQEHLDYWHTVLMPHINHTLRGFYRKYPESVEISLESIGDALQTTKPTILVICTSVAKVKRILKKHFVYDESTFGLLVCKGKIVRSRKHRPTRSMANETNEYSEKPMNPQYQERPFNGASIGAYAEGRHLLPVSFGGLIMVDGKPYGLTVHHMLDNPSDGEDDEDDRGAFVTSEQHEPDTSVGDDDYEYDLSESGSDTSSVTSSIEDDVSDDSMAHEPGDIDGIPEGCGDGYFVTQPALDDVDENFFPSDESREEDHLESFTLGEVYASSGIRRRYENGLTHEIDWALFEFAKNRLPSRNYIQNGEQHCRTTTPYPVEVVPTAALHDLEVHCMARTSGLQTGRILPGMTVVKIFGRQTPSQSYQVAGRLGIPGDSGAWVIDNALGRACGHVLAWSSRKKVAYICPMDIILADIAETLDAKSVRFPHPQVDRLDGLLEGAGEDESTQYLGSHADRNSPKPMVREALHIESGKRTRCNPATDGDSLVTAMDSVKVSPNVALHT